MNDDILGSIRSGIDAGAFGNQEGSASCTRC